MCQKTKAELQVNMAQYQKAQADFDALEPGDPKRLVEGSISLLPLLSNGTPSPHSRSTGSEPTTIAMPAEGIKNSSQRERRSRLPLTHSYL